MTARHFMAGIDADPGRGPIVDRWGFKPRVFLRGTHYAAELQGGPGDGIGPPGDHFHVHADSGRGRVFLGTIRFSLGGTPYFEAPSGSPTPAPK